MSGVQCSYLSGTNCLSSYCLFWPVWPQLCEGTSGLSCQFQVRTSNRQHQTFSFNCQWNYGGDQISIVLLHLLLSINVSSAGLMDKHFIVKSHTSRLYMQMYCWLPLFLGSCQSRWWLVVVLVGAMRWITIPAARYLLSPVGRRRIIFMLIWSIDVHVAWGAPLPLLYA